MGAAPQYTTYSTYGDGESDYRSARWTSFREPYRFTGKEDDIEVGLNYHGARYYSPALHRWISPDPVTVHSAGSDFNPYSYGYGNPTSYVDPDGREPFTIIAIIVVAAVVSATTSATVQYATTGHIDWGLKGVAGAAIAGAVGAATGIGVGAMAAGWGIGAGGAAAVGGAAGGAMGGATGTAVGGGSLSSIGSSALTGAICGAVGGAVGVWAGSTSSNAATAFGGTMAGTGAGTSAGIGWGALTGDAPTWQSAGIAFGAAFGGAIASTALSSGVQAAAEAYSTGNAAPAKGHGDNLSPDQILELNEEYRIRYSKIDWDKVVAGLKWYDSEKTAAYAFLDQQNPKSIRIDREIYTIIVESNGKFAALPGQLGLENTSWGFNLYAESFKGAGIEGVKDVAMIHTHSAYGGPSSGMFSGGDYYWADHFGYNSYLGTPTGDFKMYNPITHESGRLGSLPPNRLYLNASCGGRGDTCAKATDYNY